MRTVKLSEVVKRVKDFVDKDNTDLIYYVGGEHFDNCSLTVNKKGIIKGSTIGPAFNTRFKENDVLLMSRNPHLRKAGKVDFEGICSDVSYVIRTKDEKVLLQAFIPILFQSDKFWHFAEMNKKGSTNFFLNWSDFERFEFDLPTIEEQKHICDLIWSQDSLLKSYERLIELNEESLKTRFISIFGDLRESPKTKLIKLGDICKTISGGTPTTKHPEYYEGNIPWITTVQLGDLFINETNAKAYITKEAIDNSATHLISANSILFGTRVGVGKSSISTVEMCTNQDINAIVNIDTKKWNLVFIKAVLDHYQPYFDSIKKGATILGITTDDLKGVGIPSIALIEQEKYADFVIKVNSIKHNLEKQIDSLFKLRSSLLGKYIKEE